MLSAVTWHLRCFTLLRIHSLVLLLIRDFKQFASATLDGKVILRAVIHASFVNFEVANQWSKTRLQWRDLATRHDMIHHSQFTEMDHETGFFHSLLHFYLEGKNDAQLKSTLQQCSSTQLSWIWEKDQMKDHGSVFLMILWDCKISNWDPIRNHVFCVW